MAEKKPLALYGGNIKELQSGDTLGGAEGEKITELAAASSVVGTDVLPVVVDPGGTPVTKKVTVANLLAGVTASLPVYARVSGSNVTTTGQSLVDITGLSVALAANSVYDFEAVLSVGTSAVTTGTRYGVQFSAAGASVECTLHGTRVANTTTSERITALNTATATAYLAATSIQGAVLIRGILTTGSNAGNLTIQHLKVTSGTSTVYINSFLKVTKIS